jgi:hypothetical protein
MDQTITLENSKSKWLSSTRIVVKLVDGTFVQNLIQPMIKLHETCVQAW